MKENLTLKIFTVDRLIEPMECDYVKLTIADDMKGKFSGSYGIKKGHARAVFSLAKGNVTAYKDGEIIFFAETSDGFATLEDDTVSVTVNKITENI